MENTPNTSTTPTPNTGSSTNPNQAPPSSAPSGRPPVSGGQIALFILFILLIVGAGGLYFFTRPTDKTTPKPTQTVSTSTTPTPSVAGTTETATSTPNEPIAAGYTLGDTARLFKGDDAIYKSKTPSDPTRWTVTAKDFTDSRCPSGVQCVWAGEQTVVLHLSRTKDGKEESQDLTLGTTNNRSAKALDVILTLKEIDDGKGGTYAEVEVK